MAAHTYWRLYIGAKQNLYAQMGTVSFLDAAQVNQSTGGTATASSEYGGSSWAAGNAFDGNPTSEWASAGVSSSEWIAYQHPSPVDIVFVGVNVSASYPVSGLALQYSDDGVSWSAASPLYLLAGQPALTSGSYTVLGLSASRRPLVLVDGRIQELPAGDTIPVGAVLPAGSSAGQVLKWNGTAWVAGTDETGGGGGISHAPSDGKMYGSKNGSWQEITAGGATAGRMMIPIMAGSMQPSASGGSGVLTNIATSANMPDVQTLNFHQSTQQHCQFAIPLPKRWNRGTITARFRWSHAATTTNFGVVWGIQAVAVGDDEAINQAYGTAVEVTDTGGTTNRLYVSGETAAFTVANTPADGDTIFFRVYRKAADAADTLAIVARLHGVDLFVTTNAENDA